MTNFMAYDFSDSMTNFMTYDFFVPLYKHFQVVNEIQFAQNCHELNMTNPFKVAFDAIITQLFHLFSKFYP